jgi:lipopolysaccharide heptosyltransferase II
MATTQTQSAVQSHNNTLDDYGYPLPPGRKKQLRTLGIRISKSVLGACISVLMTIAGFLLWPGRRGKHLPPLTPQSFHPRRILVIRLDLIGDLVLSLTVVRALKRTYPDAEIDLLAVPASGAIAWHDPDLHEVIGYDPNIWRRPQALLRGKNWREARALLKRLRARRYDLAVSVFGPWAGTLAVLSGAPRRVGFGRESYFGFMTDNVPGRHWKPGDRKHEVDYCLQLAQKAGAAVTPEDRVPRLFVEPEARQAVERLLSEAGVQEDENRPLIACHVSSNNGQSKRWPLPYWATLLDRLIREQHARVVLTGAPIDLPLIEEVTKRMQERPINLAGKTSLPQLAALLQRADLMISGDSGPMHIAAAVGTPLIAIHGPTDPAQSGPISPKATILRSPIWCSPCYRAKNTADCRFYTTQCMKNITPSQVFEVAREKLQA